MSLKPNNRFRPTNWQVLAKSQSLPILQNLMIDILDDSYESDLTEEEHERLILISEHAIAKPLSPAAKTVLDAFLGDAANTGLQMDDLRENVAAALRAAVTHTQQYQGKDCLSNDVWTCDADELLAIADELETQ
jgi:hypothetical protein